MSSFCYDLFSLCVASSTEEFSFILFSKTNLQNASKYNGKEDEVPKDREDENLVNPLIASGKYIEQLISTTTVVAFKLS